MRNGKGSVMPKREVPCCLCGKPVMRAVHFVDAKCRTCHRQHGNAVWRATLKEVRKQARRFRIVCHILGWEPEQFEEMLGEMKRSPMAFRKGPETLAAHRDFWNERRAI